jgi:hypothetical protein
MSGLDLGHAVNSAADWLCGAPLIRGVVNNPVFTALLIVALAAVVMMALYHRQLRGMGAKRALRALLYVFLLTAAVQFVHHYAVQRCARRDAAQKGVRDIFSSIEQSRETSALGTGLGAPATGGAPPESDPERARPRTGGYRPDNVASDASLDIEDVVVRPSATSPTGAHVAK